MILMSCINTDVLKTSGNDPCGICQTGVGRNAIFCGGCIRNAVTLSDHCALTLSSGAPDALGLLGQLMKEIQRFRLETKSLTLPRVLLPWGHAFYRRWLRAGCDHTLQMYIGQILPIASPSHKSSFAPSDKRSGVLIMCVV